MNPLRIFVIIVCSPFLLVGACILAIILVVPVIMDLCYYAISGKVGGFTADILTR